MTTNTETARLLDDPVTPWWRSLPIIAVDMERDPAQRPGAADRPAAVVVNDQGIVW